VPLCSNRIGVAWRVIEADATAVSSFRVQYSINAGFEAGTVFSDVVSDLDGSAGDVADVEGFAPSSSGSAGEDAASLLADAPTADG